MAVPQCTITGSASALFGDLTGDGTLSDTDYDGLKVVFNANVSATELLPIDGSMRTVEPVEAVIDGGVLKRYSDDGELVAGVKLLANGPELAFNLKWTIKFPSKTFRLNGFTKAFSEWSFTAPNAEEEKDLSELPRLFKTASTGKELVESAVLGAMVDNRLATAIPPALDESVPAAVTADLESRAPQVIAGDTPGTVRNKLGDAVGPEFPAVVGLWDGIADKPEFAKLDVNGYNPMNTGNPLANAIGDGDDHPLSERFATLAAAQAVFPFVTSLAEQIDESAFTLGFSQSNLVLAPPGTYKLKLGFLGQTGKRLEGPGVFKPSGDTTATALFRVNGSTGWAVKGVTFDANGQIATAVRVFGDAADFLIEDVVAKGATDVGVNLQGCTRGTFRRVKANTNGTGGSTDAGWFVIATDCDFISCEGSNNTGNGWRFLGASATSARNKFTTCRSDNNTRHGFYGVGTRSDAPVDYVFTDCFGVSNGSAGLFSGMALHMLNRVRVKGAWVASNTEHGLVLQDQYGARVEVAGTANGRELVRLQADFSVAEDALSGARQCEVVATAYGNGVGAFTQRGPISIEGSCRDIKIRLIAINNAGVPVKIPTHVGYADPYNIEIDGQFSGNAGGNDPVNDGSGAWWGSYLASGVRKVVGTNSLTETMSNKTLTNPTISQFTLGSFADTVVTRPGAGRMALNGAEVILATRIINAKSADYTLILSDAGKQITMNSATALTLTIPTNAAVAFPTGTVIDIAQLGTGQVTVAGAGVTIRATPGPKISAQYGSARLLKVSTDTWLLTGSLSV